MTRAKVLMSAYSCDPQRGSEPGIGWNTAREVALHHDVWLMTSRENSAEIEQELAARPLPSLRLLFVDSPAWLDWTKKSRIAWEIQHYAWQIVAYLVALRLHRTIRFDVAHHVTVGRYWMPSFLALLPVPFIWGPVGGGESMPRTFWRGIGLRGVALEVARNFVRRLVEWDPFLAITARRSALALATTDESRQRIERLGARSVLVVSQIGISDAELDLLANHRPVASGGVRFISIGRLLFWKGFHLGLAAFARLSPAESEYWIVGTGPAAPSLMALARELGVSDRVHFRGRLSREETLRCLEQADVLVHPSLHEAGGMVCVEAMAAGKPVICLDLGGPALQVTADSGFKVAAPDPEHAVTGIAQAMTRLSSPELRARMGAAGRIRARDFSWRKRGEYLSCCYRLVGGAAATSTIDSPRVPPRASDIQQCASSAHVHGADNV